jgi:hypothetical protein
MICRFEGGHKMQQVKIFESNGPVDLLEQKFNEWAGGRDINVTHTKIESVRDHNLNDGSICNEWFVFTVAYETEDGNE